MSHWPDESRRHASMISTTTLAGWMDDDDFAASRPASIIRLPEGWEEDAVQDGTHFRINMG